MNKLAIIMITTLLLTATGTALAQDFDGKPGRKGQHHQRGMKAMPVVEQFMRSLKRLDLSDEQKDSIKTVMQGLKADVRPIMKEMKTGHVQLKELIKADNYDEQAVTTLAEKEGMLAAKRLMMTSRALSDIYSLLTDEQRAELDTMAAKRQQQREERREHRAD